MGLKRKWISLRTRTIRTAKVADLSQMVVAKAKKKSCPRRNKASKTRLDPRIDTEEPDSTHITSSPNASVEFLEVDDMTGKEDPKSFAEKMSKFFMNWWAKEREASAHRPGPKKRHEPAPRTKRLHKQQAREDMEQNGYTMLDFFAPVSKKQRVESPSPLINLDALQLANLPCPELPNPYGDDREVVVSCVENNLDIAQGQEGGEEENREKGQLESLEQVRDNGQNEVEDERRDEGEVMRAEDDMPTVQNTPQIASSSTPSQASPIVTGITTLCPNDFEGEDPVDIQQNIWSDRILISLVGEQLTQMKKKHHNKLDKVVTTRIAAMEYTINFYTNHQSELSWTKASLLAARGAGRGVSFARNLRRWIISYALGDCSYQSLPHTHYASFDTTFLQDEDLSQRIRQHLQSLGKYFKAQDVVDFIASDAMQACLGTRRKKISLKTAQRWLKEHYRYGHTAKGLYVDGHEREDVVKYRESFVKRMDEYSRRMVTFDASSGEVKATAPVLANNERELILITHDESTFYENDRKRRRWVPLDEPSVPQPKGEGTSVMVSDFLSPSFGRLMDDDR